MIVNHGYIRGKTRQAEDREIRTTVYNILRNTEAIGCKTMSYTLLIQRVGEHLEEIRLTYNTQRVKEVINEMILEDILYRVTGEEDRHIGLVK